MEATLSRTGRILFAIPFGIFGLNHLLMASAMKGMVPSFVPGGVFWIYLTGLALIAATISIISQKQVRLAAILLSVLLAAFMLTIHIPNLANESTRMMAIPGLLKDFSLAGAALLVAGLYSSKK